MDNWNWTWPAIALAFVLGVVGTRWLHSKLNRRKRRNVNPDYFRGLNFLLNEETDKAIDVFIKALEVDDETVELHLALGGLFRRQGQVDRATKIHQNLIARPSLTEDQRMQAVHELAQDYYKVGWLDRAENLFLELRDSEVYRPLAINGLSLIYQQEKEWQKAIDVLRQHDRKERLTIGKQIAHYFCELAEAAIDNNEYPEARRFLAEADKENSEVARVKLLHGQLKFVEGDYAQAIVCWRRFISDHPDMSQLVVANMIESFQNLNDLESLEAYLLQTPTIPRDKLAFLMWFSALSELQGRGKAIELILERVRVHGLSSPVAGHLLTSIREGKISAADCDKLLRDLLDQAKNHKIEYTCLGCGFATKAMYWFCPNCGEWESFR